MSYTWIDIDSVVLVLCVQGKCDNKFEIIKMHCFFFLTKYLYLFGSVYAVKTAVLQSSLQLELCCVVVVKLLPVHHHIADYIFWSFAIIEFIFSHLKIEFHLSRC